MTLQYINVLAVVKLDEPLHCFAEHRPKHVDHCCQEPQGRCQYLMDYEKQGVKKAWRATAQPLTSCVTCQTLHMAALLL